MLPFNKLDKFHRTLEKQSTCGAQLHATATAIESFLELDKEQVYIPHNFAAYELLPPDMYDVWGGTGLQFFDPYILWTIDAVRDYYNVPLLVNTWKWNPDGARYRGLRTFETQIGAEFSMHKFGKAIDFIAEGVDSETIRDDILYQRSRAFQYITGLERDTAHVHIDRRNRQANHRSGLFIFSP